MLQLAIKIQLEYDSSSSLYRLRSLFIASNIWISHVVLATVDHEIYLFPVLIFFLTTIVSKYFVHILFFDA